MSATQSTSGSPSDPHGPILTMHEAAERLRISRWKLLTLIQGNEVRTFKVGSRRFVTTSDLHAYIDRQRMKDSWS